MCACIFAGSALIIGSVALQTLLDDPFAMSVSLGVMLARPVSCNGLAANWLCALQHTAEAAGDVVDAILSTASESPEMMAAGHATLRQLAYATDADGRVAMDVATKQAIRVAIPRSLAPPFRDACAAAALHAVPALRQSLIGQTSRLSARSARVRCS
jgi:hypothetical protein